MIRESRMTCREAGEDSVVTTLVELRGLHPEWGYVGTVGSLNLYRLCVVS